MSTAPSVRTGGPQHEPSFQYICFLTSIFWLNASAFVFSRAEAVLQDLAFWHLIYSDIFPRNDLETTTGLPLHYVDSSTIDFNVNYVPSINCSEVNSVKLTNSFGYCTVTVTDSFSFQRSSLVQLESKAKFQSNLKRRGRVRTIAYDKRIKKRRVAYQRPLRRWPLVGCCWHRRFWWL